MGNAKEVIKMAMTKFGAPEKQEVDFETIGLENEESKEGKKEKEEEKDAS